MARRLWGIFLCPLSANDVIKYIINQEAHHSKIQFRDEYLDRLKKFDVEFNNQYLFEFYE
jgi:putative transposase